MEKAAASLFTSTYQTWHLNLLWRHIKTRDKQAEHFIIAEQHNKYVIINFVLTKASYLKGQKNTIHKISCVNMICFYLDTYFLCFIMKYKKLRIIIYSFFNFNIILTFTLYIGTKYNNLIYFRFLIFTTNVCALLRWKNTNGIFLNETTQLVSIKLCCLFCRVLAFHKGIELYPCSLTIFYNKNLSM